MTDEDAVKLAANLLAKEVPNPGPTWLEVIDLCLWVKDISKRLPKPKRTRNEYMRDFMRRKRAEDRAKKAIAMKLTESFSVSGSADKR